MTEGTWGGASFRSPRTSGPQFHRRVEGTAGGSLKTGRPPEEDPGERVSHLSSSLGKRGGPVCRGGPGPRLAVHPAGQDRAPGHPAPALHAQPPCTQIRDEGLRETGPSVAPLPPSRPDSPLCWAPPRPGRPGPCCQGGARRRVSRRCRAAPPGAGVAPLPDPRHNRTPAGSRTTHLQV